MGVRGLTKHLLPYAEWKVLGNPAEGQSRSPYHEGTNVVIDGPSDRIYFDGFLPEHKIDTRQERLEKSITELFDFRASHPNGFPSLPLTLSTSAANNAQVDSAFSLQAILRDNPQSLTSRNLPSPPFIVPAVIHALRASEFKCSVDLVPGEADPYCAARASVIRGVIFTADSDLLIHDSGPGGSVVLLDHIQLEAQVENGTTLRAPIFEPGKISQKLGIGSDVQALQNLAYLLQEVPGISFHQALQKVRSRKDRGVELAHEPFHLVNATNQTLARHEAALFDDDHLRYFRLHGQHLDPRLAEICLQLHLKVKPMEHAMYLPVLLEDPARASAWEVSVPFRHLAYTYLIHRSSCGSMQSKIYEYRRKGQRLVQNPLSTSSSEERNVLNEAFIVCDQLGAVHSAFNNIHPTILRWRYVAARYVLDWYDSEAKTLPSVETVMHIIMGKGKSKWSWDGIHFAAQIDGVLYSVHMIRQVLQYLHIVPSEWETSCNVDGFASSAMGIAQILKDLPVFEKLLLSTRETRWLSDSSRYVMPGQELRKRLFPVS
ncbi:MAG: hypothetical protein OHK93_004342 [Ramalina farinacea]|uniref:Asteroid domain-containing protein n=1 Tax=Ramalina farinacea TaxID=258253 RepID=A0AA43TP45_9LECA|nr:hypothetical protein [Ramalina farinacea]